MRLAERPIHFLHANCARSAPISAYQAAQARRRSRLLHQSLAAPRLHRRPSNHRHLPAADSTGAAAPATTDDYYSRLGIQRSASQQDIKAAFRQLALKVHPDVSDHPEAEQQFRAIAEAYDVLSDAESRQLYDAHGPEGLKSQSGEAFVT